MLLSATKLSEDSNVLMQKLYNTLNFYGLYDFMNFYKMACIVSQIIRSLVDFVYAIHQIVTNN